MTTIVLADDHNIVRQGLRTLLETEPEYKIVGEASDGLQVVQLVEKLQPDILLCDLMMGGINGLEVARQVSKRSPKTSVIILSMYGTESYVLEALRAGAKAYLLKDAPTDELLRAVSEVAKGRRYLGPPLSELAIDAYVQKAESNIRDSFDQLTTREREVFNLAAQGCTNAQIASRLYISARTVEIHRSNMMHKLNLTNQADLIRYAMQKGIIPPASDQLEQKEKSPQ